MKERVGNCQSCGDPVYCLSGFLNGVVSRDGRLRCFSCEEKHKDKKEPEPDGGES